jgi:hypothetical protein
LAALKAQKIALRVPARRSSSVTLASAAGWYDYVMTSTQILGWTRHMAGHLEGLSSRAARLARVTGNEV